MSKMENLSQEQREYWEKRLSDPNTKIVYDPNLKNNNYREPTWGDFTKDLVGGTAEKLGGTVDAVNKYVAGPIIGGVSDLVSKAGTATDNETVHQIGEAGKNYADTQLYGSNLEDQAKDYFKTDYESPKKEITKALGKGIGEGIEWATGVKAFGAANQALNGAKVISKTGTAIAAPWIDKLNNFLQSGATGVTNTAAQFGLGRATEKVFEKEEDGELVSFTKSLGSFIFAGSVVNSAEKGIVKAFKESSKVLLDTADYLKNPTPDSLEKIKHVFSKENISNIFGAPTKGLRNKLYEKLVMSADAELDVTAMQALEKVGIPVTPLVMFKNSEKPLAIANFLPNVIYRKYMENLEKKTLNVIEDELTLQLGKYDKKEVTDSIRRTMASDVDQIIAKPDYKKLESESKDEIKNLIDSPPIAADDPNMIGTATNYLDHLTSENSSQLANIGTKSKYEIKNRIANIESVKNASYKQRDAMVSEGDTVSLEKIIKASSELAKQWDIPAVSGTDYNTLKKVGKEFEKKLTTIEELQKLRQDLFDKGIDLSNFDSKGTVSPSFIFKLKDVINAHIHWGKDPSVTKLLNPLKTAISETLKDGVKNKTIKNKLLPKAYENADEYFANEYLNTMKMEIVKGLQKNQSSDYILNKMNNDKNINEIRTLLESTTQGVELFKILKKHKIQEFLIDEINLNGKLNVSKMRELFNNPKKENILLNLMDKKTYQNLLLNFEGIATKLERADELLNNPIYSSNSVEIIMQKMKTRAGLNDIFKVVDELPKQQADEIKLSLKQFLSREHFIKYNNNNTKNSIDVSDLSSKLNNLDYEDYGIGVLGKEGFDIFKQKIEPIVDKLLDIKYNDYRKGGYVGSDATFIQSLKRLGKEIPYAIGGYEFGGVKGAIAVILGKEWIAKSFAKAATDPTLTKRLITVSKSKDDAKMINFLEKIAKDIIYQMSNAPTLKKKAVDSAVEGAKAINGMVTPAPPENPLIPYGAINPF